MLKRDIKVGGTYLMKVSNRLVPVRIMSMSIHGGWNGENQVTGRMVRIKTAAKLRKELQS